MKRKFFDVFGAEKPIIGMLHLLGKGRQEKIDNALYETELMMKHGVSAVLVENYFGDDKDVENVLSVLLEDHPEIIYGVNVLGDYNRAFTLAKRYDAAFVQVDSICGHLTPDREQVYFNAVDAFRAESDALLLGGVRFKYQPILSGRSLSEDLKIGSEHCDAIVVTGPGTGIDTDIDKIKLFRTLLGDFPLIVGAGMTAYNAAQQLEYSDGGIVGSFFKKDGAAFAPMDEARIEKFMKAVREQ